MFSILLVDARGAQEESASKTINNTIKNVFMKNFLDSIHAAEDGGSSNLIIIFADNQGFRLTIHICRNNFVALDEFPQIRFVSSNNRPAA